MRSRALSSQEAGTTETYRQLQAIIGRHLSALTVGSLLGQALDRAGLSASALQRADLVTLLPLLERGARLFMRSQADVDEALQAVRRLMSTDRGRSSPPARGSAFPRARASSSERAPAASSVRPAPDAVAKGEPRLELSPPVVVLIRAEEDIVKARVEARRLAESLGASSTVQTHLATMVSELARNIVLYAGAKGTLALAALAPPAVGVSITARDQGAGILNLAEVFSGTYRSRQGMGLGLRGVRKLASYFEIDTAPGKGTTVRAQLRM